RRPSVGTTASSSTATSARCAITDWNRARRSITGLLRRRRKFARIEHAVAVAVLLVERGGDARAIAFARHRPALAAGQLVGGQHAVAVAVHGVEGIAHPVLVLGQ